VTTWNVTLNNSCEKISQEREILQRQRKQNVKVKITGSVWLSLFMRNNEENNISYNPLYRLKQYSIFNKKKFLTQRHGEQEKNINTEGKWGATFYCGNTTFSLAGVWRSGESWDPDSLKAMKTKFEIMFFVILEG
jgi:hypothetical protein